MRGVVPSGKSSAFARDGAQHPSLAPSGLGRFFCGATHGLRRGLHSFAASRLRPSPPAYLRDCADSWKKGIGV